MVRKIYNSLKTYKLEFVCTICLFSNLYMDIPSLSYYLLWVIFGFLIKKYKTKDAGKRKSLTYILIGIIIFSTIVNFAFLDYRWIMMCIILYLTMCKTSLRFFIFKERFLFVSLFGYIITGLLNNYAHHKGINYQLLSWLHAGEDYTIDFSGFTCHPMWLSAACGIGILFITYWINYFWSKKRIILALLMLPLVFFTLQTLVWGGSRSALGISIVSSFVLLWLSNKKIGRTITLFACFSILAVIVTPIILSDSEKMQSKQGGLNLVDESGKTSRSALWDARIDEFASSPIWGVGFGVTGVGEQAITGRAETGSGWLTVLSQTGLIGFILAVTLVLRSIPPIRMLRNSPHMALYASMLLFLCLHTCFEAYLFQSGWYLCFVLWLTISVLDDYKRIYHQLI